MSQQFLGEVRVVSFNFPPKGWAFCNGQLLPINQNQALFALLGTTYGGNGVTTFALPNLQGRSPLHMGSAFVIGQNGGETAHTLSVPELPSHSHQAMASSAIANLTSPAGNTWGNAPETPYSSADSASMSQLIISSVGGSQPHENMQPFLVLSFIIALQGIFPSRN